MQGKNKKSEIITTTRKPTRYKPEYCEMLIDHMSNGFSMESFAGVVGVARRTVYLWKEKHEEFEEAYEIGIAKSLLYHEKLGAAMMKGALRDKNGNPVKHDTAIYIFSMKNKFKWTDKPQDQTSDLPSGSQSIQDYINSLHKQRGENDNTIWGIKN